MRVQPTARERTMVEDAVLFFDWLSLGGVYKCASNSIIHDRGAAKMSGSLTIPYEGSHLLRDM